MPNVFCAVCHMTELANENAQNNSRFGSLVLFQRFSSKVTVEIQFVPDSVIIETSKIEKLFLGQHDPCFPLHFFSNNSTPTPLKHLT